MSMDSNSSPPSDFGAKIISGTLAIDLGSSNTVVAFQGERDPKITLIDLRPISRAPGEVPSLIWLPSNNEMPKLFGHQIKDLNLDQKNSKNLISDFKRWIGDPNQAIHWDRAISPEKAGELLLKEIWARIPAEYDIKRLVLTAPVETYKSYRKWLYKVCNDLNVKEIALVDEPTAAAIGADQIGGSKLLVIDFGGSTIDMSMVALEGGEGHAAPIAQLIRFEGQDLEGKSKQILRCARVLGKAGIRLGGRDLDRWISKYLYPDMEISEILLDAAELLKCELSNEQLPDNKVIQSKLIMDEMKTTKELKLNRMELEELLQKNGLIKTLDKLLAKTMAKGRSNGCEIEDLSGVILVGGGSRIPIIRRWLKKAIHPAKLLTPPPIEAVAKGALSLTPGVKVKDVLNRGVSLRCWDQKKKQHIWHPLFLPGQTWPTVKPLEIILATSQENQMEIELKIADYNIDGAHEVIYIDGIPNIKDEPSQPKLIPWSNIPTSIKLKAPGKCGEDCLKLSFSIDESCNLIIVAIDLRDSEVTDRHNLGSLH